VREWRESLGRNECFEREESEGWGIRFRKRDKTHGERFGAEVPGICICRKGVFSRRAADKTSVTKKKRVEFENALDLEQGCTGKSVMSSDGLAGSLGGQSKKA